MREIDNSEIKNKQNLEEEIKLHEQQFYIDSGHWSAWPLFASRYRHWLMNDVQKIRFYGYLYHFIKKKPYRNNAEVLLAPVGDGCDIRYLQGIYKEIHGIDIYPVQLKKCPKLIVTKEADILDSNYDSESFDIVIVSLFFHHLHEVGFAPFITELYRILRKGGIMAVLEPSAMYPFSWIIALLSRFLGDFPGKVKAERPLLPAIMIRELKHAGFDRIEVRGMVFKHIAFPFFLQSFINLIDWPLRALWPIKLCANTVGYYCEKT